MKSSHGEARCMCSELVTVKWVNEFDRKKSVVANLEEIWPSGARLQIPEPVRPGSELKIVCRDASFKAQLCTCAADFVGYVAEAKFEGNCRWSRETYLPEHFFDPLSLLPKENIKLKELEERNTEQLAELCKSINLTVA